VSPGGTPLRSQNKSAFHAASFLKCRGSVFFDPFYRCRKLDAEESRDLLRMHQLRQAVKVAQGS